MKSVFVSSTFKDMQFERDAFKNILTPRIDAFLANYGENIHFGDLRWGVNTSEMNEEESSKKVLKICLDEIDDSRPYMIVLIGDRYGWIPPISLMEETLKAKNITNVNKDISVTNLEIEYGAFLKPDLEGRILFFFRNLDTSNMDENEKKIYQIESSVHKEKLEELKNKIREKYRDYVFEYNPIYDKETHSITNLEPFLELVYEKITSRLNKDLEAYQKIPNYQKAITHSEHKFLKYNEHAYLRKDLDYSLGEWHKFDNYHLARFKEIPTLIDIWGEEGSGRKTYLSSLYKIAKENNDEVFNFPFVLGMNEYTKDVNALKEMMINTLEDVLSLNHQNKNTLDRLTKLIAKLDQSDKYVRYFIMNSTNEVINLLRNIETKLKEVVHISFYLDEEEITERKMMPTPFFHHNSSPFMYDLDEDIDKIGIINAISKSKHKELSKRVINKILEKEKSNNPQYLSLLVERLLMLDSHDFQKIRNQGDGMEAIESYMMEVVDNSGNDIKELAEDLFIELSNRINIKHIPLILRLMTLDFEHTMTNMAKIFVHLGLEWNETDYSLFTHSIPSLFKESSLSSDLVEFGSKTIKEAAIEVADSLNISNLHDEVAYFITNNQKYNEIDKDTKILNFYSAVKDYHRYASKYLDVIITLDDVNEDDRTNKILTALFNNYAYLMMEDEQEFIINFLKDGIDELIKSKKKIKKTSKQIFAYFLSPLLFYNSNSRSLKAWNEIAINIYIYLYEKYQKEANPYLLILLGRTNEYIFPLIKDYEYDFDEKLLKKFEKAHKYVDKEGFKNLYNEVNDIDVLDEFWGRLELRNTFERVLDYFWHSSKEKDNKTFFLELFKGIKNNIYENYVLDGYQHIFESESDYFDIDCQILAFTAIHLLATQEQLMFAENKKIKKEKENEVNEIFAHFNKLLCCFLCTKDFKDEFEARNDILYYCFEVVITLTAIFSSDTSVDNFIPLFATLLAYCIDDVEDYLTYHPYSDRVINGYETLILLLGEQYKTFNRVETMVQQFNFLAPIAGYTIFNHFNKEVIFSLFSIAHDMIGLSFVDEEEYWQFIDKMFARIFIANYYEQIDEYFTAIASLTADYLVLIKSEKKEKDDKVKYIYDEYIEPLFDIAFDEFELEVKDVFFYLN